MKSSSLFTRALLKLLGWLMVGGAGSVALSVSDPSLKYEMDAQTYKWIGQKIYGPDRIDVAFVGTSRTWTAVNTERLNAEFPDQRSYNFGANWFGRDVKTVIIQDLLQSKAVKAVVLEIFEQEPIGSHPYAKFMAGPLDFPREAFTLLSPDEYYLLKPRFREALNGAALQILGQGVKGYYFLGRRYLGERFLHRDFSGNDRVFGHHRVDPSLDVQQKIWADLSPKPPRYSTYDDQNLLLREYFLSRIAAMCRARGVQLYFLWIPQRNAPFPGPRYLKQLRGYGIPIVLPWDGMYVHTLWRDQGHLNTTGANEFTRRLAKSALYRVN